MHFPHISTIPGYDHTNEAGAVILLEGLAEIVHVSKQLIPSNSRNSTWFECEAYLHFFFIFASI